MIAKPDNRMMSTRVASRLAWGIWILTFCVALLTFLFVILNRSIAFPVLFCCAGVPAILILGFIMSSITVGALIAWLQAGNPIGWIFCSSGLLISLWLFALHYAIYTGLTYPNSLPGGAMMAWIAQWLWVPGWGLLSPLLLLFPNGHLLSRRWRLVAASAIVALVVTILSLAFMPGQLGWSVWVFRNPFGLESALGTDLRKLLYFGYLLFNASILASALSLISRIYKAVGVERQQIKWLVYAGAVLGMAFLSSVIFYGAAFWGKPGVQVFLFLAVIGFPLSVGIAILKYHLYDIDLIRTLDGALTAFIVRQFSPYSEQREDRIRIPDSAANTSSRGHWLFVARVTWVALTILTVGLFISAIPGYLSEISEYVQASRTTVSPAWDVVLYVSGSVASIASTMLCLILAVMLVWRKPNERMAVFVSCYLLMFGLILSGPLERTVVIWPQWEIQASAIAKPLLFATPTIALLALFPSGRFVPRWTRWLTLCSVLLIAASFYLPPYWWPDVRNPIASLTAITWAIILLAGLYAQIYRYRQISNSTERQQTKWVVFGFFLWLLLVTVVSGPYAISYGSSPASPHPWWAPVVRAIWFLSSTILPVSLTIAVMRYRLFDIDVLINRSVVYLTLTAIVVGIYVLVVGYLGVLFRTGNNLAISLVATGLVAVVFQPLRQRLQRGVNRLMYGERDDPYAVLSRLSQRLEAAYAPESVLPTIVEVVAQTLKLPYVGLALNEDAEFKIAAEFGRSKIEPISLPLIYQGEPVGELILAPRAPGDYFTPSERQLLDDLARQAGVAAHAVRLTADLQRSRERLVAAREEERRRLRRDLHDGLGPQLASLALKLETARNRMAADPQAASLLTDLSVRTQEAVADIRRLVYALRPPALDELGLVMALREGTTQYNQQGANGVNITFDAPEKLPPLPAAVEVAVYRIAHEALTNVVRHAEARTCFVRLMLDESAGVLYLQIQDDGKGLPMKRRAGVGLNSMRERAEELGGTLTITPIPTGGTSLLARLPCRLIEPARPINQDPLDVPDEEV